VIAIHILPLPAPGAGAVWKYKAIYGLRDEQAGQCSDAASVSVMNQTREWNNRQNKTRTTRRVSCGSRILWAELECCFCRLHIRPGFRPKAGWTRHFKNVRRRCYEPRQTTFLLLT